MTISRNVDKLYSKLMFLSKFKFIGHFEGTINPFVPTVPQMEHSILAKIAKKFGHKWVKHLGIFSLLSAIFCFLSPHKEMILNPNTPDSTIPEICCESVG